MIDFKENVQPGILCLVKCIEVIREFLDNESKNLLENQVITTCKRIYYGKYFPKKIHEIEKLINKEINF